MRNLRAVLCSFVFLLASGIVAAPIRLLVDATDAPRRVLHAHEVIPAQPGALTLWYPKWIPGEHGPTGPLVQIAGMKIAAGGTTLQWSRDLRDMFAFHLEVPQ